MACIKLSMPFLPCSSLSGSTPTKMGGNQNCLLLLLSCCAAQCTSFLWPSTRYGSVSRVNRKSVLLKCTLRMWLDQKLQQVGLSTKCIDFLLCLGNVHWAMGISYLEDFGESRTYEVYSTDRVCVGSIAFAYGLNPKSSTRQNPFIKGNTWNSDVSPSQLFLKLPPFTIVRFCLAGSHQMVAGQ